MAIKGNAAGIPFLHPWANRLAGFQYRVGDREVVLNPSSLFLHFDDNGLPIHGVPWSHLSWKVPETSQERLVAQFEWARDDLLEIFPFRHRLEMTAMLQEESLTLETTLIAGNEGPVPVSFGFHPYFGVPGLPRERWRLKMPAMRRFVLDRKQIPTGKEESFEKMDTELGELEFDDGFALSPGINMFSLEGAGRRITVEFVEGYPYAQVFAPKGEEYVALEPMTAPTNALTTGNGLRLVDPNGCFRAVFRIHVNSLP